MCLYFRILAKYDFEKQSDYSFTGVYILWDIFSINILELLYIHHIKIICIYIYIRFYLIDAGERSRNHVYVYLFHNTIIHCTIWDSPVKFTIDTE